MSEGIISITKGNTTRDVYTLCSFFETCDIIVRCYIDKIVFTKPTLGFLGKTIKTRQSKNEKGYRFCLPLDIITGQFNIDEEESNEDKIVVYYEDEI